MYELLLVVLMIFCLNGVVNIINKREKFHPAALAEPIKEGAYYNKLPRHNRLTQLPYNQNPIPTHIWCHPRMLYNPSCQPDCTQTISHNYQNSYPKVVSGFSYPFTNTENMSCLTDEHNVRQCWISQNRE